MSKTALLFAGQGAQVVGMGKDLAAAYPEARALFERADAALGYGLSTICFEGPEASLTQTENAQPGIFLVSWVAFHLLRQRVPTLTWQATAGLSLGEFTALAAADALTFEDALRVVRLRGRFMQEACDATRGGMAAVLNLDEAQTRAVCDEAGVELANLNCPGQLVISGELDRVAKACELAKARGAKRAVPLPVAGAYHSRLMASAQPKLAAELARSQVQAPAVPVIANVTAAAHLGADSIRDVLVRQVCASVRWEESMRALVAQGFTRFIELGPGKTLAGFMKRIAPEVKVWSVGDVASLESVAVELAAS
ncbi:MAG: ACP S-malonyltransferase [Verrucomicrobiales bacterium]|nr:ACP S-malonyltransferase [Verrucomicrobiales bacterium]